MYLLKKNMKIERIGPANKKAPNIAIVKINIAISSGRPSLFFNAKEL